MATHAATRSRPRPRPAHVSPESVVDYDVYRGAFPETASDLHEGLYKLAETHGIELLEWFVVGPHGAECPRELLGEPERWPCD